MNRIYVRTVGMNLHLKLKVTRLLSFYALYKMQNSDITW